MLSVRLSPSLAFSWPETAVAPAGGDGFQGLSIPDEGLVVMKQRERKHVGLQVVDVYSSK